MKWTSFCHIQRRNWSRNCNNNKPAMYILYGQQRQFSCFKNKGIIETPALLISSNICSIQWNQPPLCYLAASVQQASCWNTRATTNANRQINSSWDMNYNSILIRLSCLLPLKVCLFLPSDFLLLDHGCRTFPVAGACLWNDLPSDINIYSIQW